MDYAQARIKMVDNQIRTTDVTAHSVLSAFGSVPREAFVPENLKALAYIDNDMEVAPGRFVMQPSPLAKLLQLGEIHKTDKVLEVGCATGYASAILAQLAGSVVALESDAQLIEAAKSNLTAIGVDNVRVVQGDLEKGYPPEAPYDVIFINGSVEFVPDALLKQLKDGGRLISVVGYGLCGSARISICENGQYSQRLAFNTSIRPLPGFRKVAGFVF